MASSLLICLPHEVERQLRLLFRVAPVLHLTLRRGGTGSRDAADHAADAAGGVRLVLDEQGCRGVPQRPDSIGDMDMEEERREFATLPRFSRSSHEW